MYSGTGSVPVPDPTALTSAAVSAATEQWRRELASAIALLQSKVDGNNRTLEARLDAGDRAVELLQHWRDLQPNLIDDKVKNLGTLVDEKFKGVTDSIQQRDVRLGQAEQAAKDAVTTAFTGSEKAVTAALQAAKEAVGAQSESFDRATTKAELATTKLLDALSVQISTSANGLDDKIDDLKEISNKLDGRITTIESRGIGAQQHQAQNNWVIGAIMSGFALLVSIAGLIIVITKL